MQVALIAFLGASWHHIAMPDEDHKFPSQLAERFQVRMPDGLRDRLRAAAAENNRSMNAEIVSRLERYDSLGGEVDAATEVARAIAVEVDRIADPSLSNTPLTDQINEVLEDVAENGSINRAKIAQYLSDIAREQLRSATLDLSREARDWLAAAGEPSGRTASEELERRINLLKAVDYEFEAGDLRRTEAGPIADYIDEQVVSRLQLALDDMKVELLNAIAASRQQK